MELGKAHESDQFDPEAMRDSSDEGELESSEAVGSPRRRRATEVSCGSNNKIYSLQGLLSSG